MIDTSLPDVDRRSKLFLEIASSSRFEKRRLLVRTIKVDRHRLGHDHHAVNGLRQSNIRFHQHDSVWIPGAYVPIDTGGVGVASFLGYVFGPAEDDVWGV